MSGDDNLRGAKQFVSESPAPPNLVRHGSRLDTLARHGCHRLMHVRIEAPSFGLDRLDTQFAQSSQEQPMRCGDSFIERHVLGARCQCAFECVERRQEAKQGVTPALLTRPLLLPRDAAPKVLEIRKQTEVLLLLLLKGAAKVFDLIAREPIATILRVPDSALPSLLHGAVKGSAVCFTNKPVRRTERKRQDTERRDKRRCQILDVEDDDFPGQGQ